MFEDTLFVTKRVLVLSYFNTKRGKISLFGKNSSDQIMFLQNCPPSAAMCCITLFMFPVFILKVFSDKKNSAGKCCIASDSFRSWMKGSWLLFFTVCMGFFSPSLKLAFLSVLVLCLSASTVCVSMFRRIFDDPTFSCQKRSQWTDAPKVNHNACGCISSLQTVFTAIPGNGTGFDFWLWL